MAYLEYPYDPIADCRVGASDEVHEGEGAEQGDILVVAGLLSARRSPQRQVHNLLAPLTLGTIIYA